MSQATTPMGTLTKNTHRHPPAEISRAPNDGPVATARAPTPPQRATTWDRRSWGKAPSSRPSEEGSRAAAPTPWTTRPSTSRMTEGATPHSAEPRQKMPSPAKNTRRLPTRSAVRPAVTSREPNTIP